MSCKNCKNKHDNVLSVFKKETNEVEPTKTDIGFRVFNVLIRIIMFGIGLLALPIIILFVVYLLFKTIVLNKGEIDMMPSLLKIAKGLGIGKRKIEEESPEDYEDLDVNKPEEYDIAERVDKIKI